MSQLFRNAFVYMAILLFLLLVLVRLAEPVTAPDVVALSAVAALVEQGKVAKIATEQDQQTLRIPLDDGSKRVSRKERNHAIVPTLTSLGVSPAALRKVTVETAE